MVSGKVMADDVVKLHTAKTVHGLDVKINASKMHLHSIPKIKDSNIVKADIIADNDVIHVIARERERERASHMMSEISGRRRIRSDSKQGSGD